MIRAIIFTCCLAFLSLFAVPQNANAQTATVDTTNDTPIVQTDSNIERAYRAVKRNDAYQYELADAIPQRPASKFEKAIGRFFASIFSFFAPLLEIIFWLGLGALGLAALYLVGRAIYETRFVRHEEKADETPEIPLYQPAQAQARILLDEVDKLAAEGRYGEAVHTLLFRSIQDIDRNRPNIVRRSLTSREIGSLSVLTTKARTAFSTIAGVSELAHFGGVPVNESGFKIARTAYADLTGQTATPPRRSRR